jgi:hypothetical protein
MGRGHGAEAELHFRPERVTAKRPPLRSAINAGPPLQIPAEDLRLLRRLASRTGIPEVVLVPSPFARWTV